MIPGPFLFNQMVSSPWDGVVRYYDKGKLIECTKNGKQFNPPGERVERLDPAIIIADKIKYLKIDLVTTIESAENLQKQSEDTSDRADKSEAEIQSHEDMGVSRYKSLLSRTDPKFLKDCAQGFGIEARRLKEKSKKMQEEIEGLEKQLEELNKKSSESEQRYNLIPGPFQHDKSTCELRTGIVKYYKNEKLIECTKNGQPFDPPGEKVERLDPKVIIEDQIKHLKIDLVSKKQSADSLEEQAKSSLSRAEKREKEFEDDEARGISTYKARLYTTDPSILKDCARGFKAESSRLKIQAKNMEKEIEDLQKQLEGLKTKSSDSKDDSKKDIPEET